MQNYRKSDYAINKNSPNIVYRFHNEIIEITLEDYLKDVYKRQHFMVLRGVTSEGKILVADPASKKRSEQEWDISIILDEARKGAAAGGPLWAIY